MSSFSPPVPSAPGFARRSLHHATFYCDAPEAKHVALIGDFNQWNPNATPMHRMADGRWMASLELKHGHHRYVFLVDGQPMLDPRAAGKTRNENGEFVSLVALS